MGFEQQNNYTEHTGGTKLMKMEESGHVIVTCETHGPIHPKSPCSCVIVFAHQLECDPCRINPLIGHGTQPPEPPTKDEKLALLADLALRITHREGDTFWAIYEDIKVCG